MYAYNVCYSYINLNFMGNNLRYRTRWIKEFAKICNV